MHAQDSLPNQSKMAYPVDMISAKHKKTVTRNIKVIICIIAVAMTSCAAAKTNPEEDEIKKAEAEKTRTELAKREEERTRIEALESKINLLQESLTSTNQKLEDLLQIKKPVKVGVTGDAANHRGDKIKSKPSPRDPDNGYTNDAAIIDYQKAMILFNAEKYPEAIIAFSSFLEQNPDHALAGSAQFYIGESYFIQQEYKLAVVELNRVLVSYDRSPHVASALKRLAQAEDSIKSSEEAKKHRHLLFSLFPQSPDAALDAHEQSQLNQIVNKTTLPLDERANKSKDLDSKPEPETVPIPNTKKSL